MCLAWDLYASPNCEILVTDSLFSSFVFRISCPLPIRFSKLRLQMSNPVSVLVCVCWCVYMCVCICWCVCVCVCVCVWVCVVRYCLIVQLCLVFDLYTEASEWVIVCVYEIISPQPLNLDQNLQYRLFLWGCFSEILQTFYWRASQCLQKWTHYSVTYARLSYI